MSRVSVWREALGWRWDGAVKLVDDVRTQRKKRSVCRECKAWTEKRSEKEELIRDAINAKNIRKKKKR